MYDDEDFVPRRTGGGLGATIVVSIVTSALVSVGVMVGGPRLGLSRLLGSRGQSLQTEVGDRVRVPRLLTMPTDSAREVLGARGLRLKVGESQPDPVVQAGWIVKQVPADGTSVARNVEVTVTLSSGPPPVAVPPVKGMHLADARRAVTAAGLQVGAVEPEGATDADQVASTTPPEGAHVSQGTAVRLTVVRAATLADGGVAPAPATPTTGAATPPATAPTTGAATPPTTAAPAPAAGEVEVPALRGKPLRRARELVEGAGLTLGGRRVMYDEAFGSGVVLRQTPAAGARAPRGSAVDLVVNQGD